MSTSVRPQPHATTHQSNAPATHRFEALFLGMFPCSVQMSRLGHSLAPSRNTVCDHTVNGAGRSTICQFHASCALEMARAGCNRRGRLPVGRRGYGASNEHLSLLAQRGRALLTRYASSAYGSSAALKCPRDPEARLAANLTLTRAEVRL